MRGRWASEGEYDPFVHEFDDGYDTVDWVARQPWCNGSIGAMGESYYGYTTWCMALSGHPAVQGRRSRRHHRRHVPVRVPQQRPLLQPFRGLGAVDQPRALLQLLQDRLRTICRCETLDEACELASRPWKLLMEHFPKDEYWGRVDLTDRLDAVDIPVLHWSGWYDQFLSQTIAHWRRAARRRDDQYLVIGATDHMLSPERTGRIGQMPVAGIGNAHDRNCRFFDRYLKGMETAFPAAPVTYFVLGRGEWRTAGSGRRRRCDRRRLCSLGGGGRSGGRRERRRAPPPTPPPAPVAAAPTPTTQTTPSTSGSGRTAGRRRAT